MALKQTGVQFVAKDLSGFLSALDSANAAVNRFERGVGKATSMVGTSISGGPMAWAVAMGTIGAHALETAVDWVVSLGEEAVRSVMSLQDLTITLESLAARDILAAGAASDMNEALEMAAPIADVYLGKLRDLSVTSPFPAETITQTFTTVRAFGIATDTAFDLTRAMTNMAAVNRHIPGVLERIGYNFSQMSIYGKVTMRDVRDLALAGVDLARVFREELGMSIDEVNESLQAGDITMETVSQAFVQYADRNFGKAAERASRTLSGLVSNFKDLLYYSSIDLLGPSFDHLAESLGKIFDRAREFMASGILSDIGIGLGVLTDNALRGASIVNQALGIFGSSLDDQAGLFDNTLEEMDTDFRSRFENMVVSAFEYGANIVESLASGVISGASAVISALTYIADIFIYWLSPGSPPNLLPELPRWGLSAITEWLEGMTKADFSVLKAIQTPLQAALDLLVQTGKITKEEAGKSLADLSTDLAEALSTGTLSPDLLDEVAEAAGMFGEEIADLVETQFAYAQAAEASEKATKDLADAEKYLADVEDQLNDARVQTSDLVNEYNRALRAGATEASLAAKRAEVDASQAVVDSLSDEVITAQDKVDAQKEVTEQLKDQMDVMKDAASLQEELVRQLISLTQYQIVQPERPETGKGGGEKPAGGAAIPAIPEFPALDTQAEAFKARIEGIFTTMWENIKTQFENSQLALKWDTFTGKVNQLEIDVLTVWYRLFGPERGAITQGFKTARDLMDGWWEEHGGSVETILTSIQTIWDTIIGHIKTSITSPEMAEVGALLGSIFSEKLAGNLEIIGESLDTIAATLSGDWSKVLENLRELSKALSPWGAVWDEVFFGIEDTVDTTSTSVETRTQTTVDDLSEKWKQLDKDLVGESIIPEMMQAIYDAIDTKLGETNTNADTKLNELKGFFDAVWNAEGGIVQIVGDAISQIVDWFTKPDTGLNAVLKNVKDNILTPLQTGFNLVGDAIDRMVGFIEDLVTAVLGGNWARVWDLLDPFLPGSPPPLAVGLDAVRASFNDLMSVDLPKFQMAWNPVVQAAAPAGMYGNTYGATSIQVNVNANISSSADVQDLANQIAWVIADKVRR